MSWVALRVLVDSVADFSGYFSDHRERYFASGCFTTRAASASAAATIAENTPL